MSHGRTRVAILGGGPAALSAAWELTQPDQQDAYEVTLYQLGWRLGGKCASGRDRDGHCEIQEHGLHVFFGYYDNAFEVLEGAYRELAESGGSAKEMAASACLPEEFDGRLDLTISIVYETIEAYALAGCNVSVAETNLDRGHRDLADGQFTKACDWYAKAYTAAAQACP